MMRLATNPFTVARESLSRDRRTMAVALGSSYSQVSAVERGFVKQIPRKWAPRLDSMGIPYDGLARSYTLWLQELLAASEAGAPGVPSSP